jgi:VWFA-related protein
VLLAGVALAYVPLGVLRAQDPGPTLTINQLDSSNYPELRAVVTVLDARGLPAQGLVPSQFQAFDGGTQLPISSAVSARDQELQLNVVVVIDVSGSMEGEPLASARAAASEFVLGLGPNDRAALVAFADEVTPLVALTTDRTALTSAISALQAQGGTALYEAVQVGAFLAAGAASEGQRAAVILLSDGENATQASDVTGQNSLEVAAGSGIPVYPIGFGSLTDVPYLQQIASVTAGEFRTAIPGTIADVYNELSDLLRNQYVLTVQADRPADGAQASLQLVAFVGPAAATSVASFQRGSAAPALPPPPRGSEPSPATEGGDDGGGSSPFDALPYAFGGVVLLALAGGGAYGARRWYQHRRELAHQLEVVQPNPRLAAAQGLPQRRHAQYAPGAGITATLDRGMGRLIERGGDGRTIEILQGPIILGTSGRVCHVVLHDGGSIAPEHARVWLRGRRYVLHHVGGMSRKTFVNGQEADWVILDPGDEIAIGKWRFTFDDGSGEA